MKFYTNSCNLLLPKAYWFLFALTANVRKMVELMDSILLDYESWWHCLTALWYQPGLKSLLDTPLDLGTCQLHQCTAFRWSND
ncbi:hypothetical protein SCA6_006776 [Theobroma cacao]